MTQSAFQKSGQRAAQQDPYIKLKRARKAHLLLELPALAAMQPQPSGHQSKQGLRPAGITQETRVRN
eukprot:1137844-Pelagomonas_calceolata.AAC.8